MQTAYKGLIDAIVSQFRIPADVFDRIFGLKENFPDLSDYRHDLNYPEIPNSWNELFEKLE